MCFLNLALEHSGYTCLDNSVLQALILEGDDIFDDTPE